jgi:hypothetical protein
MDTRECLEWGALLRETAGGSGDGLHSWIAANESVRLSRIFRSSRHRSHFIPQHSTGIELALVLQLAMERHQVSRSKIGSEILTSPSRNSLVRTRKKTARSFYSISGSGTHADASQIFRTPS